MDYDALAKQYGGSAASNNLDELAKQYGGSALGIKALAPKERTFGEAATDIAASVGSGIGKTLQVPGQLYGLIAGNVPSEKPTGLEGIGKSIEERAEAAKSESLKAKEAERSRIIQEAESKGIWEQAKAAGASTIKDPALLISFLAEMAPNLLPVGAAARLGRGVVLGGQLAKGVGKEAAEVAAQRAGVGAALGTGAVMQGADIGTDAMTEAYRIQIQNGVPEDKAKAEAVKVGRAAGLSGAAISLIAQRLPGARQMEEAFAGKTGVAGRLVGGVKTGLGEAYSEAAEEGGGAFSKNLALREVNPEQSLTKGVGTAAALGAIGGGALGGATGILQKQEAPPKPQETPKPQLRTHLNEEDTLKSHPVHNPTGSFTATELGELATRINDYRESEGKHPLRSFSIEDLVDANIEPAQLDSLVASKTGYQGQPIDAGQVQQAARDIDLQSQGAKDFLTRATGTNDLNSMTPAQLYAAYTGLSNLSPDVNLEEGTNAHNFKKMDYETTLENLNNTLVTNPFMDRASVIAQIKQSGLDDRQADSILKSAFRNGDLALTTTPHFDLTNAEGQVVFSTPNREIADRAAVKENLTVKESDSDAVHLPQTTITAEELTGPADSYDLRAGNVLLNSVKSEEDAYKQAIKYNTIRNEERSKIRDERIKLLEEVQKDKEEIERMEATGMRGTPEYENTLAEVTAKAEKAMRDVSQLEMRQIALDAPVAIIPTQIDTAFKPSVSNAATEIHKQLAPLLKKYGLENVSLKIVDSIRNGEAEGNYAQQIISVALDNEPGTHLGVMRHEIIHALKELGAFTPKEWELLNRQAQKVWIPQYMQSRSTSYKGQQTSLYDAYQGIYQEEKGDLEGFNEYIQEEAIAEAFRNWKPQPGFFGNIGYRLTQLFNAIRNAFKGLGFQTADTVFKNIEAGKVRPKQKSAIKEADKFSLRTISSLNTAFNIAKGHNFERNKELKEVLQALVNFKAEKEGIDLKTYSDETKQHLVEVGLADAIRSLKSNASAVGWYDRKVNQALAIVSLIHPEIATDPNAKFAFTWALAVTSNGQKVEQNFELAERAYKYYRRYGKMPTNIRAGQAQKAINQSLKLFNEMEKAYGLDLLRSFMATEFTASQIEKATGIKVTGEFKDTKVLGAAILGPKIGNGFFSNLNGIFDRLTMDRWLMRTWGRYTGTLVEINQPMIEKKRQELKDDVAKLLRDKNATDEISKLLKQELAPIESDEQADALAAAIQKTSMLPENRKVLNKTDAGESIRKSGNALFKYLDGQKEAPNGPAERDAIRDVFKDILKGLHSQGYQDMTMSDLQALLWYPEKRLYDIAKDSNIEEDYTTEEAPDYANAAAKLARSKKVPNAKIQAEIKKVDEDYDNRAAAAKRGIGDGASQLGPQGRVAPLNRKEYKRFLTRGILQSYRQRNEKTPETYTRDSGRDGKGIRVLGVVAKSKYSPKTAFKNVMQDAGASVPAMYELQSQDADIFQDAIQTAKNKNVFGAAVTVYPESEYAKMRLFIAEDGKAGFALKGNDIVSVFSEAPHVGASAPMLQLAVQEGGRKLDAFDTVLPDLYFNAGFKIVSRTEFNEEYQPDGWSKQTFKQFNNGKPDVVFMVYDPANTEVPSATAGRLYEDYDKAVEAQDAAVNDYKFPVKFKTEDKIYKPLEKQNAKEQVGPRYSLRPTEPSVRPSTGGGRGITLGERQEGAGTFSGIHYGKAKTERLSGSMFGSGIRGEEAKRLSESNDPRIKRRVYFYIPNDAGSVMRPEAGLGQHVYTQTFDNILPSGDEMSRLYRSVDKDFNAFESAVVDAGYDGYAVPSQGMMVILNHNVPVKYEGLAHELRTQGKLVNNKIKYSLRAQQKNQAKSRIGDESKVRFERTKELQEAVQKLDRGEISRDEYNRLVDELRPVMPYEEVPEPATREEAVAALTVPKKPMFGVANKILKEKQYVQLRLDIPAYENHNTWIVSIHSPKSTDLDTKAAFKAGAPVANDSVARITNAHFGMDEDTAFDIARGFRVSKGEQKGMNKATIATILGQWKPTTAAEAKSLADEALNSKDWIQVGMDPFRHGYFYNRETMEPIWAADEVIQIGPLVLAKNATVYTPEQESKVKYSLRATETPEFKQWFGKSKIVDSDGEPKVMYHGTARDITAFRPKQANAIFVTDNPDFASVFSGMSEGYMLKEFVNKMTNEDKKEFLLKVLKENKKHFDKEEYNFILDSINTSQNLYTSTNLLSEVGYIDKKFYIDVRKEIGRNLESSQNIMPLYVKSENPFDYENPEHVKKLIEKIKTKDKAFIRNRTQDLEDGDWSTIEHPIAQKAIKELGHDGFYVFEANEKNLAVYEPSQLKSAIGNIGTFDINNPDIRYSVRANLPAATNARIDATTGQRKTEGFMDRILSIFNPDTRAKLRAGLIFQFEALEKGTKARAAKYGNREYMADVSATAAALESMRSKQIVAAAMRDGVPVYRKGFTTTDNFNGTQKGLLEIFSPLAATGDPDVWRCFQFYAGSKRGARLDAEGREHLFTPADLRAANAMSAQFKRDGIDFDAVYKDYQKWNEALVKYMKDTGVLSARDAAYFTRFGDYIPFYRQVDGESTVGPKIFSAIAGVQKPKALKGGTEKLGDFLENVIRNASAAVESGMKNVAANRGIRDALDLGTARQVNVQNQDTVSVKENGVTKFYELDDPLLFEAFKGLNVPRMPWLQILAKPADILRNFVTKDPGFILANIMRDSVSAWVTSGSDMKPVVDSFKQFGKILAGQSPEAVAMAKAGLGGYEFKGSLQDSADSFEKALRAKTGTRTKTEKALLPVTALWDMLEQGSNASDMATRAEIYKRVLAETGNEAEALFQASEVMNFSRKGNFAVMQAITALVPFMNARIQGMDVLYRSGFGQAANANKEKMQKAFIVRSMAILGMTMAYWAMVHDDDEYKRLTKEERDGYWIVPGLTFNDKPFRFPIPFEIGVVFKVFPERILEYTMGQDTEKDFRESITRNIVDTLKFNPIPQAFIPIAENITNHSFFTGEKIVGRGLEDVAKPLQYTASTSLFARELGEATGMSPIQIENVIRGYTGTMGMYAVNLLDSFFSTQDDPVKATTRAEQLPVIKRFFASDSGTVAQYYDLKGEVDEVVRTVNFLSLNNPDKLEAYLKDNENTYMLKDFVSSIEKDMKQIREYRNAVNADKDMSGDEKRTILDELHQYEIALTSDIKAIRKEYH